MNTSVCKITVGLPIKHFFGCGILQKHLNQLKYLHNHHYTLAVRENACMNMFPAFHRCMLKNSDDLRPISMFLTSNPCRTYAKKAIVKESKSGKGKKPKVLLKDDEMLEVTRVDLMHSQMQQVLDKLKESFVQHLSVRTTSGSIENLKIKMEEEEYPLHEIAQIHQKSANLLVINLTKCPEGLKPTLEAIQNSKMNVNPQQEETLIYIPLPKVTREHRENLVKSAKTLLTTAKDNIKEIQNRYLKDVKNKKADFSEDLIFNVQAQIKQISDQYVAEGENMLQTKQKELLGEL